MRFAILSVLAFAGSVLADGDPVNQIPDGQIQAHPTTSEAAYTPPAYGSTTVIPSPPLETTPVVETTPVAETTPVVETTPTPEVTTTTTPAAPVTTTTLPLASYPLPNNTTTPLTTGAPVASTTLSGYETSSATEGSPVGSETPQPASPNAAGIIGVHMGLAAAAVAGLLVYLA